MNTDLPLYKQIAIALENGVLTGTLLPGHRIPSIRELAERYQVNPNTAQRAVRDIKSTGLFASPRGKGTLVTNDKALICQLRKKRGEELVHSFVQQMELLGYSREQINMTILTEIMKDE